MISGRLFIVRAPKEKMSLLLEGGLLINLCHEKDGTVDASEIQC